MKRYKTLDGYQVYQIKKEKKFFFLADRLNYKLEINKLLDTLDDLKFDSVIFLFGIDTGEYIEAITRLLCAKNRVFIFEPNQSIFHKYNAEIANNIQLFLFEEEQVKRILNSAICFRNVNNIYFYAFGNYSKIYKREYDCLIEHLDMTLINASSQVGLAKRFKELFIQNMIANIKVLNQCTPIHHYINTNLNIPAIVVSGGPSLDQNIQDMLKYKEKLKNYFIITGSRTVKSLVSNDILPDMIISVDPVEANYDMMKDYLDLDIPLAFYEYSNRYLVRDYKGEKIYIAALFSQTIEAFKKLKGVYCGGSVAHACIDIANMLGCSPIIFVGQDLANTYQKHHADSASFDYDNNIDYREHILVLDVYGNQVGTTVTLNHYRKRLELYIGKYKHQKRIKFINCSYGAEITGAPHKELSEVFKHDIFKNQKIKCIPHKDIIIDSRKTVDAIMDFIDECMVKASQGIELCEIIILENQTKSLADVQEDDMDLQRILYMLQIVDEFENNRLSNYLGGYFNLFAYEMKAETLNIYAKNYEKLTSDLQYQTIAMKIYFEKMSLMLEEVKNLALETVSEFYE